MILDLPVFDKFSNKITFGLIQCFHETPNKSVCQVLIGRSLSQGKQPVVLKMWFLISGFLLCIVTDKIIEIKTENAEATARTNESIEGIMCWYRHQILIS